MASPRGASRLSAESSVIVRLAHALDAEHIDAVHSRSSNVLDEIFEIVDGDHNGQITKDEFQQLFDAMKGHAKRELRVEKSLKDVASVATEEKVKATRRLKVAFCLGTVMFIFLLISVLLNFALSYHVVDSLVKTQPSSDGRLLTKDLDRPADVQVAQSGQDVMLGLLPFLPKVAPLAVLRASPEFAILHLGGLFNQSYRALRFEGAEFLPPARIRLFVAGGGLVDLEGGYTGTFTDTTGVVHEFCSACAPVQLKSLLNSVELEEADALFNEYLDDHYDNASLICQDPLRMQVSTGLSMMNKSLADTAGGPPLMCKVASDDDEADNRRALQRKESAKPEEFLARATVVVQKKVERIGLPPPPEEATCGPTPHWLCISTSKGYPEWAVPPVQGRCIPAVPNSCSEDHIAWCQTECLQFSSCAGPSGGRGSSLNVLGGVTGGGECNTCHETYASVPRPLLVPPPAPS
jgi:hypothetical protein